MAAPRARAATTARVVAVAALILGVLTAPAAQAARATAPLATSTAFRLVSLSIDHALVDVTSRAGKVTIRARVTSPSAIVDGDVSLSLSASAGDGSQADLQPKVLPIAHPGGRTADVVAVVSIPRYASPGWLDLGISVMDAAGHDHQFSRKRFLRVVDAHPDQAYPVIRGFATDVLDRPVDVRRHAHVVHLSMHVTDDLAGVSADTMMVGLEAVGGRGDFVWSSLPVPMHLSRGTPTDGFWSGTVRIDSPQPSTDLDFSVFLADRSQPSIGNSWGGPEYLPAERQLPGRSGRVRVLGTPTARPVVRWVHLTPSHATAGTAPVHVVMTAGIADPDHTGVRNVVGVLCSAENGTAVGGSRRQLVAGTRVNGTWQVRFTLPNDDHFIPARYTLELYVADELHADLYSPTPRSSTCGRWGEVGFPKGMPITSGGVVTLS